ncbi:MAG: hypothetical protein ACM3JP_01660 [Betaproteobacteria bacterium]
MPERAVTTLVDRPVEARAQRAQHSISSTLDVEIQAVAAVFAHVLNYMGDPDRASVLPPRGRTPGGIVTDDTSNSMHV